jgi:hypothetical protein
MVTFTRRASLTFALVAVGVGALLYYGVFIRPTGKPTHTGSMPECPHNWPRPDSVLTDVVGGIVDIPEFHDCQRLIVRDRQSTSERYDSLAAVFAKEGLGSVTNDSLVGGVTLGLVFFPLTGTYLPLGLDSQYSCIVVKGPLDALQGWLVPTTSGTTCRLAPTSALALDPAKALQVRRLPAERRQEVPAVARWDWDAQASVHFIGIRCGDAWCEIGRTPLGTSPDHLAAAGMPPSAVPMLAVKGWYDEQRLAEFPEGKPIPDLNVGTVVPSPDLAKFASGTPARGTWARVANVYMHPGVGTYRETFNFTADSRRPPTAVASQVELCVGNWWACRPGIRGRFFWPGACAADASGQRWYSRVTAPDGTKRFFCVVYREHPKGFDVPAVVRWRWRNDDESIWVRCPAGCCEVNGDE